MKTALVLVFTGCMVNNLVQEAMISPAVPWSDKGSGGLLTLLQFIMVAVLSAPAAFMKSKTSPIGIALRPTKVPLRYYVGLTAMYATMQLGMNTAFGYEGALAGPLR
jgi:hypothetical protein